MSELSVCGSMVWCNSIDHYGLNCVNSGKWLDG